MKITVEKGGLETVRQISGFGLFSCEAKYTMRHAAKCTPDLWREGFQQQGSSEEASKILRGPLDGAHVESFDRLCQVINNTADVTICKSGEAERHFSKLQSERRKIKKKLENCEA